MSIQLQGILDTLPDSIIACDHEGKILRINATALKLFEVASESLYRGTFCHQFLHAYEICDEQQPASSLEPWLFSLVSADEASGLQEETIVLRVPSGREVYTTMSCLPVLDTQKQAVEMIYVFHDITHRFQKALHLQRVYHALSHLTETIARLPEHMDFVSSEGFFLLSPPVLFVGQQLVDVIVEVLDCQNARFLALGPQDGRLYFVVGSSFALEPEKYPLSEKSGCYLPSEFVDETVLARLYANQEVILPADQLRVPPGFEADFGTKNLLLIPMFLENQIVGALVIAKACFDCEYMPEDIEFVKTVAMEAMLVIECLKRLNEQAEMWARDLVRQEMHRHINEFLDLASHELKTPLTAVKGNIQLAQRRLAKLKRQIAEHPERVHEQIEQIQDSLESAVQPARLQEDLIKNLIDDARIQANTFELHMKRLDLVVLLRETVFDAHQSMPERRFILDITLAGKAVPIMGDAKRITQVINTYLENALSHSPVDHPVTVNLTVEDTLARVSVHDEGPGILFEGQEQSIWERFYNAKGVAVQYEVWTSLGLDFYLCRVFIERHHGTVGVQSEPGHGATYWFTLPIEASVECKQ